MIYRAGVATRAITPPVGMPMMGFAARDHGAEGIHDELFIRALWLEAAGERLAIVAADLAAMSLGDVALIKDELYERCDLRASHILLNCTHTHAGPLVDDRVYASQPPDRAYLGHVLKTTVETVEMAMSSTQPASVSFGVGTTDVGVGRRLPTETGYTMAPNPRQSINRDTLAVRVDATGGRPLAVVFSVSCHPTVMGPDNYQISSEYPGVACREVERQMPGATAVFLQGACGDIKARRVADIAAAQFRSGGFDDVEAVGQEVASDVLEILGSRPDRATGPLTAGLSLATLPFDLPAKPQAYYESVVAGEAREYQRRWARHHLQHVRKTGALPASGGCPVQLVRLGDVPTIAAFGGELCSGHAGNVRAALQPTPSYTLGYTNGVLGYLPTDETQTCDREGTRRRLRCAAREPCPPPLRWASTID